jgi:hypothetical protein
MAVFQFYLHLGEQRKAESVGDDSMLFLLKLPLMQKEMLDGVLS